MSQFHYSKSVTFYSRFASYRSVQRTKLTVACININPHWPRYFRFCVTYEFFPFLLFAFAAAPCLFFIAAMTAVRNTKRI